MSGLYDWILNSLKSDESPLTNQLPAPIPSNNLSGLPVPFQTMPSESGTYNPFLKVNNVFTNNSTPNPLVPQDIGTTPTTPNDPLKTALMSMLLTKPSASNSNKALPKIPPSPSFVGNPSLANFKPISPLNEAPSTNNTRSAMLMKMLAEMPMS